MRILISIPTLEYYRNYITSPAFGEIKGDCLFLVSKKVFDRDFPGISRDRIFLYDYPENKNILHRHLFNINTGKFRRLSSSFAFRFIRLSPRLRRIYNILALPFLYQLTRFFILKKADDQNLRKIIKNARPDIMLLPSSGYEGVTFEIIKLAGQAKIPTLLLVDNWDNLCSKTIFTYEPDYLTVWGPQAVRDAWEIHGIPSERVFPIGTPRFLNYNRGDTTGFLSPYPFKYALFAGMSAAFDELSALQKLDELITRNNYDIKIVYRPHPLRQKRKCPDNFFESEFRNVVLDLQARKYYKTNEGAAIASNVELPDLEYYPRALANMEFMICPLSTMLLEGLLFSKPIFVLAYDDGIHITSAKNLYENCRHFEGLDRVKNLGIISEFSQLGKVFTDDLKSKAITDGLSLNYYLSEKTWDYPCQLRLVIEEILS